MKTFKKIVTRWIIVEIIISMLVLSTTSFLFGSIKKFNPKLIDSDANAKIFLSSNTVYATKRATVKKVEISEVKQEKTKRTAVVIENKSQDVSSSKKAVNKVIKQAKANKSKQENQDELQGVVKKAERSIYMQGGYYLEVDGKMVAILKGSSVNLEDYVGKNVKASGKISKSVEGPQVDVLDTQSIAIL